MRFELLTNTNLAIRVDDAKQAHLTDGQTFKIKVYNNLNARVQFDLFMNGKVDNKKALVGSWILNPYQPATIERGTLSQSLFTFKNNKDVDLNKLLTTDINDWGLVSARFRDELQTERQAFAYNSMNVNSSRSLSKGVGGIVGSGHSDQQFGTTNSINAYGSLDDIYAVRLKESEFSSINIPPSIPHYDYP